MWELSSKSKLSGHACVVHVYTHISTHACAHTYTNTKYLIYTHIYSSTQNFLADYTVYLATVVVSD